jgi:hypothetical protein
MEVCGEILENQVITSPTKHQALMESYGETLETWVTDYITH